MRVKILTINYKKAMVIKMKKLKTILLATAIGIAVCCTGCDGNISPTPTNTPSGDPTDTVTPNNTPTDIVPDITPNIDEENNPNNDPNSPNNDPMILPGETPMGTPDGSITNPENRLNPGYNNIPDSGVLPNNNGRNVNPSELMTPNAGNRGSMIP